MLKIALRVFIFLRSCEDWCTCYYSKYKYDYSAQLEVNLAENGELAGCLTCNGQSKFT